MMNYLKKITENKVRELINYKKSLKLLIMNMIKNLKQIIINTSIGTGISLFKILKLKTKLKKGPVSFQIVINLKSMTII